MNLRQEVALETARELAAGRPVVVGYLAATSGSTYHKAGVRMLFRHDGSWCGLLSGGCLEADLAAHAAWCFQNHSEKVVQYDTNDDGDILFGTGLGCKGSLTVALVPVDPSELLGGVDTDSLIGQVLERNHLKPLCAKERVHRRKLVIFGAGTDARPLCRWAGDLDWQVVIIDPRPVYARSEDFPDAHKIICAPIDDQLISGAIDFDDALTAVVIMTHNFERDLVILKSLALKNIEYVGLLGPRRRASDLMSQLTQVEQNHLSSKLHSPIGLDLGGYGPEAVALAILAQLQLQVSGASGVSRRFTSPNENLDTVILAAGMSSRMGVPKQLIEISGETLVRRAVHAAMAAGQKNIIVVVGAYADGVRAALSNLPVTVVENADYQSGMASSIVAGVRSLAATSQGVLLMTCDQPLITPEHLAALINLFKSQNPRVCATEYGGISGVPALFSPSLYPELLQLKGERGARALITKYVGEMVTLPCQDAVMDCDTPQDLELVRANILTRNLGPSEIMSKTDGR
jgi:xanthine dehydrogenase accessory factor